MPFLTGFLDSSAGGGQWSNRLVGLLSLVITLLIVQAMAKTTWLLWPLPPSTDAPIRAGNGLGLANDDGPNVSETLKALAPFGVADQRKKPEPVKVVVPETRLDLELKGVVAGSDGKSGGAIIADRKEGDRFFAVGASLPGGVVLDEVHPQRVVLLRNGRQEVLKLVRESLEQDSAKAMIGTTLGNSRTASNRKPSRRNAGPEGKSAGAARGPSGIKTAIRIRPLFRGGKIKGFRITPGRDRRVFSELGFKAGDLLVSINGKVPQDPKEIFSVLDELQGSGSVSVEVTRRGRPVTLTLGSP